MTEKHFRIAVGIATRGRAAALRETLIELRGQTRYPDAIIVSYVDISDVAGTVPDGTIELLQSSPGLTHQRNTILDVLIDYDAVLFLDDDFLPAPRYLEAIVAAFEANPEIVVTTGHVIGDGACGPGFSHPAARKIIESDRYNGSWPGLISVENGYGCNMAIRLAPVRQNKLRFDERLPLYGWYEDIDFTRRLGRYGTVMGVQAARGVHLGLKFGRTSGRRLGYSQVVNPVYLARKGSFPWRDTFISISRNVAANLLRSCWPEQYIDRRGRLVGNALAMLDMLRGWVRPEKILDL